MKPAMITATLAVSATAASCDCWRSNGTSADQYTHYRFFDYRNISNVPPVPELIPADAEQKGSNAPSSGGFVNDSNTFGTFWTTETFAYPKSDDNQYEAQSSAANVYIQAQDSYEGDHKADAPGEAISWLTLRSNRPSEGFATMSQLTSNDVYLYGTVRFAGRVIGPTGACAGVFSYALEDGDNNEADIEMLTKDVDYADGLEVHYTNQPSDINGEDTGTSLNSTLAVPFYKWQTHRLDWRKSTTDFYGDAGEHKLQISRSVPKGDSQLTLNMWSTGNDWTGSLEVGEAVELQILWLEWAYNTTDTADATCSSICDLDNAQVGYLSPSKFADEQFAMNKGTNAPVAIPALGRDTDSTKDSTLAEGGDSMGSAPKQTWNSMLLVGAGVVIAVLMSIPT